MRLRVLTQLHRKLLTRERTLRACAYRSVRVGGAADAPLRLVGRLVDRADLIGCGGGASAGRRLHVLPALEQLQHMRMRTDTNSTHVRREEAASSFRLQVQFYEESV